MEIFQPLIEWIKEGWERFTPITWINHYDRGVLLRFGRWKKTLDCGLVYKIPFIDEVLSHTVVTTTIKLSPQSLFTKDKQAIVLRAIIKYEIEDIKTFLLDVYDANDAISDMTQASIKNIAANTDFNDFVNTDLDNAITGLAKKEAKKWGIKITKVTLVDIGAIKSFRLLTDQHSMF